MTRIVSATPAVQQPTSSLTIARVAGIPIRIHATFLLLVAWVLARAFLRVSDGGSAAEAVREITVLGSVFVIVALHELGHALVARRFGVTTKDITLLPIGGVARLDHIPKDPKAELLIALGGPAVNVVLAGLLFAVSAAFGLRTDITALSDLSGSLVPTLAWINVSLALFNLVPAFPMDGGRALRALLATRTSRERATRIAARIGQGFAVLLGLYGLLGNPVLVFIALFVWMGAAQESADVQREELFAGVPARRAMMTDTRVLTSSHKLSDAAALVLDGWQRDFPIANNGTVRGIVTRERLIDALAKHGAAAAIEHALDPKMVVAAPDDALNDVVQKLRESNAAAAVVLDRGALVGMITIENVLELFAIAEAQRTAEQRAIAHRRE